MRKYFQHNLVILDFKLSPIIILNYNETEYFQYIDQST